MMKTIRITLLLAILPWLTAILSPPARYRDRAIASAVQSTAVNTNQKILEAYGKLPLSFEANQGQADRRVKFLSRGSNYSLFLTATEAVLALNRRASSSSKISNITEPAEFAVLRMELEGANPVSRVMGREELPGSVNYFIGKDESKWRGNIPTYAKVSYQDVYPGIDLVYYGELGQVEFDFLVAPGADPETISLRFRGADSVDLDAQGDLVIQVGDVHLRQRKPRIYQKLEGGRQEILGGYEVKEDGRVGFHVSSYDADKLLVIDPILSYSTYLGGSGDDFGCGIAVDSSGNAYVTGWTGSANFPVVAGGVSGTLAGGTDAFVAKINPAGNALLYSTFLGGTADEFEVIYIALDSAGNAYISGATKSADFPVTAGTPVHGGGEVDAFVAKLNPSGSALIYARFLGGSGLENGQAIAVDSAGNAYVVGFTSSPNFPTTPGVFQPNNGGGADAFVTKLNAAGSALVYSSYLGGSNHELGTPAIALDAEGNVYISGSTLSIDFPVTPGAFQTAPGGAGDAYVTKVNSAGSGLAYSSYLGGSDDEEGRSVAVDAMGQAYLAGITWSANFPVVAGAFQSTFGGMTDVYLAKVNQNGSALLTSSFLGGGAPDISRGMAIDAIGNVYVSGATHSPNFPTTPDAIQTTHRGNEDVFVTKVNSDGNTVLFSTLFGGAGNDRARGLAVDRVGDIYLTGFTGSTDFPTANPLQATFAGGPGNCFFSGGCDAFIAKISDIPPTSVRVTSATSIVSRGETLSFTIRISNRTNQPQGVAFMLALSPAPGILFPILPPQPFGLTPGGTVTLDTALPIPSGAPTGQWMLEGTIGQPSGTGMSITDKNRFFFTVN